MNLNTLFEGYDTGSTAFKQAMICIALIFALGLGMTIHGFINEPVISSVALLLFFILIFTPSSILARIQGFHPHYYRRAISNWFLSGIFYLLDNAIFITTFTLIMSRYIKNNILVERDFEFVYEHYAVALFVAMLIIILPLLMQLGIYIQDYLYYEFGSGDA